MPVASDCELFTLGCYEKPGPLDSDGLVPTVWVKRFVEGDEEFNSFDNLAYQPKTGNLYVFEDHSFGDIFACFPDGTDRDIKSGGCVRVLSVKDSSAEPTGFEFFAAGKKAVVAIQHSNDAARPSVDDYPTDDIIIIAGFGSIDKRSKRDEGRKNDDG